MFLKKAAIITLSSLFLTTACVTTTADQKAVVTDLETQLTASKETISQNKLALEESQSALEESQLALEKSQLTLEKTEASLKEKQTDLEKAKQENATLAKKLKEASTARNNVVVSTPSKKDTYLDKTVLGQTEWIYVNKAKKNFKARIDTGATTSSINAVNMQRFERDGEKWVKFNLTTDEDAELIEAPLVRIAKIIQSGNPGESTERPVIKLNVRIGDVSHNSEFTLTDRMHMDYPVLIGRTFMKDVILVDVSQEYIHSKYQAKAK